MRNVSLDASCKYVKSYPMTVSLGMITVTLFQSTVLSR